MRRRHGTRHLRLRRPGGCDPNQGAAGFWQPPGIRLQMHGTWFAKLSVMEGWSRGVFWLGGYASACPFVPSAANAGAIVDSRLVKTWRCSGHC